MKVVITTEVKYKTGVEEGSYAFFENSAKVHWSGHPDSTGTSIGGNIAVGTKIAEKGPVYPDPLHEVVNFETEWNIKINTDKIANTADTYAYDYFIFDKEIKATELRKPGTTLRIEEVGNSSNTVLRQSGVPLKSIFRGENNRHRFVYGSITGVDSFNPDAKVYKIYAGTPERHVGDLVEVGGFQPRKVSRFKLKSTLAEGAQLVGVNERQYGYNFVTLVHDSRVVDTNATWPRYNSKITNKQTYYEIGRASCRERV